MSDAHPIPTSDLAAAEAEVDRLQAFQMPDAVWLAMLNQLICYHLQFGHCFVPAKDRQHPQLSAWLRQQVALFHQGRLSKSKQRELESLGMDWDLGDDGPSSVNSTEKRWQGRFAEMVAFKEKHGHLRITLKNQLSAGQMHWRDNQRIRQRQGAMTPQQKAQLDAIGFEWEHPERLSPAMEEHNVILWESFFTKLLAFREKHGHCQVPKNSTAYPGLGQWVRRQRGHDRKNTLLPERRQRLEQIGFVWKSDKLHFIHGWQGRFAEIVAFKEKHGHLHITLKNQLSAGQMHWRDNQRIRLRQGVMPPEQKAQLDAIGFEWEHPKRLSPAVEEHNAQSWESFFTKLLAFREKHGHCQVPKSSTAYPGLGQWVRRQRGHDRKNTLLPERRQRLEQIGFAWKPDKLHFIHGWQGRFAEMVAFKEKHGHLRITFKNQLSAGHMHWRDNQRIRQRQGVMPPEQKAQLDAIGFEWVFVPPPPAAPGQPSQPVDPMILWERRYARLVEFHQLHGHVNVPGHPDRTLRKWVLEQREDYAKGTLEAALITRLESLGFSWQMPRAAATPRAPGALKGESLWDQRFSELQAFFTEHGHFSVPKSREEIKQLRGWVVAQRVYYRSGSLRPAHRQKLDSLGFPWNPGQNSTGVRLPSKWAAHLQDLIAFKKQHGHLRIPRHEGPHKKLWGWLIGQRSLFRQGKLLAERHQQLEEQVPEWISQSSLTAQSHGGSLPSFDQRLAELREFQAQHGHVNVPVKYPPNKALGNWVSNCRIAWKKGQLNAKRLQQLNDVGFIWQSSRNGAPINLRSWAENFADLQEFQKNHGHVNVRSNDLEHATLANWVIALRMNHRLGKLSADRIEKLESLGFWWGKVEYEPGKIKSWDQRLVQLKDFRRQHGHPHVSSADKDHASLETWVKSQRVFYNQGKLTPDHIQRLEAIGFNWDGNEAWWQRQFIRWQTLTQQRRTRHLTAMGDADDDLAKWEQTQRNLHRKSKLSPDKTALLTRAGLVFEPLPPRTSP